MGIDIFSHDLAAEHSALLLLSVVLILGIAAILSLRRNTGPLPQPAADSKEERAFGAWTPQQFQYPAFPSCSLSLSDIKPIPYRPFRWGQYNVTMGIRNMPWEDWIELDNQFATYHQIRDRRIRTQGNNVVRVLPARPIVGSGASAAIELVHELSEYLHKRYPAVFHVTRTEGAIKTISILPLDVTYELPPCLLSSNKGAPPYIRKVEVGEAEEAMKIAALLVQDDLALMVEGSDGRYYFQAGAICVPGFWRMRDKIGLPLDEIHLSGNVPQYREKLHTSFERFFRRLPVDKPVIRNNYFVQVVRLQGQDRGIENDLVDPEELAWSTTTNGPEREFAHGHPARPPEHPVVSPETLRLRTERQTLRRLSLSGAVLFTIRTYVIPIEQLAKEPGVPARMASAVRSWPESVQTYKGKELYGSILVEYLDKCAQEQADRGVKEDPTKKYPF
ncbi:uncharacterized protein BT62DRAFT_146262 [Guyanagaster necrorhizus]|uniref:Uncharacterized protein n=1 Tax=Guyanagaster necrorhizus TaxID=856835 RepID=A0A9P8ASC3_9AGAR|nr:uncharacterized protein BT62DRAFT_146262 [Guyanagaster necrorhizus MCA 3950]KAG7445985.1 hypothetical protein BT62DRAFT_146262 [Guyanagaster necrorhizus MCA 3950]